VLHIACEGVRGLGARKEAWWLHHTHGKDAQAITQIEDAPFQLCKNTALDLIKDVGRVIDDIGEQFGGKPIKVITIDTLNRSLRGSENKDEDMSAYIRAAVQLADHFQCVVILIHHCGHNEDRPRGHSSLLGSADCMIEAKKDAGGFVFTEVEEMRDGPSGAFTGSRLDVVEVGKDTNGNPITSCVISPVDALPQNRPDRSASLPPGAQIALANLKKAIAAEGKDAPPSNHIPSTRAADIETWRRYHYAGTAADGRTPEARKKAFQRDREKLQANGVIGLDAELVWIVADARD
jgi:hypothetical protein